MHDVELLQYVHKTAVMGVKGLQDIQGRIQDAGLRRAVSQQVQEYRKISDASSRLLQARGETPNDPGLVAQVSSEVMSTVKLTMNSSPSSIAEMVITGNTMGITKGIKHLNDYSGDDPQVRQLAEKLVRTEQANVEQMKKFL